MQRRGSQPWFSRDLRLGLQCPEFQVPKSSRHRNHTRLRELVELDKGGALFSRILRPGFGVVPKTPADLQLRQASALLHRVRALRDWVVEHDSCRAACKSKNWQRLTSDDGDHL